MPFLAPWLLAFEALVIATGFAVKHGQLDSVASLDRERVRLACDVPTFGGLWLFVCDHRDGFGPRTPVVGAVLVSPRLKIVVACLGKARYLGRLALRVVLYLIFISTCRMVFFHFFCYLF